MVFRFLRQRHAYLTKLHIETEFGPSQSADIQDGLIEKERNCIANMVLTLLKLLSRTFFDTFLLIKIY